MITDTFMYGSYIFLSFVLVILNKPIALGYDKFVSSLTKKLGINNTFMFKVDKTNRERMILSTRFFLVCFSVFVMIFSFLSLAFP